MRLGKDLIGKPIISISNGRLLGNVKDLLIDPELSWLAGIFVGQEGLLRRKSLVIPSQHVTVYGIDAILVSDDDVIADDRALPDVKSWLRLNELRGREVDTPGGTRVGTLGDVMLDAAGRLDGFTLDRVFVEGPVAEQAIVPRSALIDTGNVDGIMTINLAQVEQPHPPPVAEAESLPAEEEVEAATEDKQKAEDQEA